MNRHFKVLSDIADKMVNELDKKVQAMAIFGSGSYGLTDDSHQKGKPNANSDLDLLLVSPDTSSIYDLSPYLQISETGIELFNNAYVDMLIIRGNLKERKISLSFMKEETYSNLCSLNKDNKIILQHKRLITSKPHASPTYEYTVYCNSCAHKQQSRIIQINDGHIIAYPINNYVDEHLCLTVFQDQILTQKELLDTNGILTSYRKKLQNSLKEEFSSQHANPLDYFKLTRSNWDEKFEKFMRDRFDN